MRDEANRIERGLWLLACLASSVAIVWTLASVPYLPTHDGPQHILLGHIENHYDDPGTIYAPPPPPPPQHLQPTLQLAARGFALLFVPLEPLLGYQGATTAILSIGALVGAWSFVSLVVQLRPERRWVGLLGFAFALPWTLYMGFFSFFLSSAFGMAMVAAVVRYDIDSTVKRIVLALAFALIAHMHMFSALLTVGVVGLIVLFRAAPERRLREAIAFGAISLPVFLLALLTILFAPEMQAVSNELEWRSLAERLFALPHLLAPGRLWKGGIALVLLTAGIVSTALRIRTGTAHRDEPALLTACIGLIVLGLLLPLHMPGWQFLNPRFFVVGLPLALALIGLEQLERVWVRRVGLGAMALLVVASTGEALALHRSLADGCGDAWSALEQPIVRSYVQMPATMDPSCGVSSDPARSRVPYLTPLMHAGAMYATAHGGTIPVMFIGSGVIHPFAARELPDDEGLPVPKYTGLPSGADPELRPLALAYFAGYAAFYESFLVFGASPDELDAVVAYGFEPVWQQGSFMIAEYRGCSADVLVVDPPSDGVLQVEAAPWPLPERVWATRVEGTARQRPIPVAGALCGRMWTRVVWRGPDGRISTCGGSMPDGRMVVELTPAHGAHLRCRLELR